MLSFDGVKVQNRKVARQIVERVCTIFEVTETDLLDPSRARTKADPRGAVALLLNEQGLSPREISSIFGRGWTSARSGIRTVTRRMGIDARLAELVQQARPDV